MGADYFLKIFFLNSFFFFFLSFIIKYKCIIKNVGNKTNDLMKISAAQQRYCLNMNENININNDSNNNYINIIIIFYLVFLINRTLYITNIADSFTDCLVSLWIWIAFVSRYG